MTKNLLSINFLFVFILLSCNNNENNNNYRDNLIYNKIIHDTIPDNRYFPESFFENDKKYDTIFYKVFYTILHNVDNIALLNKKSFEIFRYSIINSNYFNTVISLEKDTSSSYIFIFKNGVKQDSIINDSIWELINLKINKNDFWNIDPIPDGGTCPEFILFEAKKGNQYNFVVRCSRLDKAEIKKLLEIINLLDALVNS